MGAQEERSVPGHVTPSRGPLTGIRVIELADEQAEYCGLTLAGLGADVIKVEPPGGNSTRRIGPFFEDREGPERSLFFWQYNRGKRSIVLDLRRPEDRDRFRALIATADVLLECAGLTFDELRPVADAMEKGGRKAAAKAVTDETLRKVFPIAGTPEECIQRIEEYREAGCTHIMLEIWGDDRTGQARLFGEAVLPHFRK